MKKGPETFVALCDFLCGNPVYSAAADYLGIDPSSIWRWVKLSQSGDPSFVFEWGDHGEASLHSHMSTAIKVSVNEIEARARHRAMVGTTEKVFWQGQPCWEMRTDIPDDITDAELPLLYGITDRYVRDEHGNKVQMVRHIAPTDGVVKLVLAAHLPKLYGNNTHTVIDARVSGGIRIVQDAPPAALPPPAVQAIEGSFVEVPTTEEPPMDNMPVDKPGDSPARREFNALLRAKLQQIATGQVPAAPAPRVEVFGRDEPFDDPPAERSTRSPGFSVTR